MKPTRATLKDVAELAGLSKTAVSLILNDRPGSRLSAEAVEKVRAAAAELDYRPNPAARSLRVGKTRTIGLISDEVTVTRFASAMIRGVLDVAKTREHTVLISETGSDHDQERVAVEARIDRRAVGVIFGLMGAKQIDVPAVPAGVPVVLLNASSRTGESTVLPDEYQAGFDIVTVLLDHGHRDGIALIGDYPLAATDLRVSATVGQRFAGIEAALAGAGVTPGNRVAVNPWEPANGYDATVAVLDGDAGSPRRITALICLNDRLALGAYQALQERGIRIPADVSIVSFDDDEIAAYLRPGLTTARIPYEEMGRQAVQILLSGETEPQHRLVPMPVVARGSVARVEAG